MKWSLLCVVVLVGLSAATAGWALGADQANPNPGVIPTTAKVGGLSYGDWGAVFWQWAFSMPAATDPNNDPTGEWAYLGQPGGPVFLLGEAYGLPGQTNIAERWVTVSRDQALYLAPTSVVIYAPDVCMDGDACAAGLSGDDLEAFMRDCADYCISSFATDIYATVDGEPISDVLRYRSQSASRFSAWYPEGSTIVGVGGPAGTVGDAAGEIPVAVTDQYGLLIAPLSPGEHTVTAGATWTDVQATAGVIYHITVE